MVRGRQAPRMPPRLPALLAALALCSPLGVVSDPVQKPPCEINGILTRAISLSVQNISSSEKVVKSEWNFQPPNGPDLFIAESINGKVEHPDHGGRFGVRFELVDERTLRIQNLSKEDNGTYKARVRLNSSKIHYQAFQLCVYDPIPVPRFLPQGSSNTSSECNVTLECWVPEKAGLRVSWRTRSAPQPLEGGSDWYRVSSDGWSLHLYRWTKPRDADFTCLVENPADRKNASFDLLSICPQKDEGPWTNRWLMISSGVILLLLVGILAIIWIWKKRRKRFFNGGGSAKWAERDSEPQYLGITKKRRPSEGNDSQDPDGPSEQNSMGNPVSIYVMAQAPALLPDRVA